MEDRLNDQPAWSAQYHVATSAIASTLVGDKIALPSSALEQLLAGDSNDLLTFRLVNPRNNRVVYSGVREFSAEPDTVVLSDFLLNALDIRTQLDESPDSTPSLTIHARRLPKGTFVKLRPLEAGYDEDWKPLLEEHLRKNFTTLTKGEVLAVPASGRFTSHGQNYRFLVDQLQPEGDAVCVVDTDLEVDIEALNEDQARETLRRIAAKNGIASTNESGNSPGGDLNLFKTQTGRVRTGEYVDYQISSWSRSTGLEIELQAADEGADLDLFVSPFGARQRQRPRDDQHVFGDFEPHSTKRVRLSPSNVELEGAEAIWVSVHGCPSNSSQLSQYSLKVRPLETNLVQDSRNGHMEAPFLSQDEVQCQNCLQSVPKQSLFLHENFCLRNNILCPHGCHRVFQKRSEEFKNHWHCPHDTSYGDASASHIRHDQVFHPQQPLECSACSTRERFSSLPLLALHKSSTCPGKLILCRFCHLQVPQEGDPDDPTPTAEMMLSGLTAHELADGARTTNCHLCDHIIKLRDLGTHLRHHDLERKSRAEPRVCRNVNCGRTIDGTNSSGNTRVHPQGNGNELGLCSTCFGPLYVSLHDPTNKALKRRVERRYLQQLLSGCGRDHCQNPYCKNGRRKAGLGDGSAISTKVALPMIKPFLDNYLDWTSPLHFCVDEQSQTRRKLAEMLQAEGASQHELHHYNFQWTIGALEAENDPSRAREWLKNFAPTVEERG